MYTELYIVVATVTAGVLYFGYCGLVSLIRGLLLDRFEEDFRNRLQTEAYFNEDTLEQEIELLMECSKFLWLGDTAVTRLNCSPNVIKASFLCGTKYIIFVLGQRSDHLELMDTHYGELEY